MRARRLDNEWALLEQLAAHNPHIIEGIRRETHPDADLFRLILHRTSALSPGFPHPVRESASHDVMFRYPAYYPAVPIEAFLTRPVFHPNIHPENGFVCLWDRVSSGDTILEALRKLQRVICWELWNDHADHVMQPEAVTWGREAKPLLPYEAVQVPEAIRREITYAFRPEGSRKRLFVPSS
jgi:ubiquitin-protein ligase